MAHAAGDGTTAAGAADRQTERPDERHVPQRCQGQQEQHFGMALVCDVDDLAVHMCLMLCLSIIVSLETAVSVW